MRSCITTSQNISYKVITQNFFTKTALVTRVIFIQDIKIVSIYNFQCFWGKREKMNSGQGDTLQVNENWILKR